MVSEIKIHIMTDGNHSCLQDHLKEVAEVAMDLECAHSTDLECVHSTGTKVIIDRVNQDYQDYQDPSMKIPSWMAIGRGIKQTLINTPLTFLKLLLV